MTQEAQEKKNSLRFESSIWEFYKGLIFFNVEELVYFLKDLCLY